MNRVRLALLPCPEPTLCGLRGRGFCLAKVVKYSGIGGVDDKLVGVFMVSGKAGKFGNRGGG